LRLNLGLSSNCHNGEEKRRLTRNNESTGRKACSDRKAHRVGAQKSAFRPGHSSTLCLFRRSPHCPSSRAVLNQCIWQPSWPSSLPEERSSSTASHPAPHSGAPSPNPQVYRLSAENLGESAAAEASARTNRVQAVQLPAPTRRAPQQNLQLRVPRGILPASMD